MSLVNVALASAAYKESIDSMMQLYAHDFSDQWSGTTRGELAEDGRYPLDPLHAYWSEAGHVPLLLRLDGHLAGFALLNRTAQSDQPVDFNMAEFFVVKKHRRHGFGSAAATAIFDRYRGQWEAAVTRRNLAAQAFWRGVIGSHRSVCNLRELDLRNDAWNGPVLRFEIA